MSATNIKVLRESKSLTQSELAKEFDVTEDYISMIERGIRNPSIKLAKKMASFFNTTLDVIFFEKQ